MEYTANDALVAVNIAWVNVSNHLTSTMGSWVRAVMLDQEQLFGEVVKVLEKDLDMLRADLRVCEENKKMIENEAVGMKRVEHQTVGLEKENMNMKSRADLLREKKESYNEDLALCKKQMDEMVEKEEYLVIEMKDLEEEVPSWRLRWLLWRVGGEDKRADGECTKLTFIKTLF